MSESGMFRARGTDQAGSGDPLNFWLGVEAFSPQAVPARSRSRNEVPFVADYGAGMVLPWSLEAEWPAARKGYVWQHVVYLGVFDLESAWDVLEPVPVEDFDARPAPRSAVAMVNVDADGTLIQGSAVLSQCVWAAGRHRKRSRLDDVFADFATDEARWLEGLDDLVLARGIGVGADSAEGFASRPVSLDDLRVVLGLSLETTGTAGLLTLDGDPVGVIRVQSEQILLKKRELEAEPGFLNSLFSADLYRLSRQLRLSGATVQYLGRHGGARKTDVRQELATVYESVAPCMVPDGRWPSNPEHSLALSQQFAVNRALADLDGGEGVFSVNGPPGTGKTTMLRDMIAGLVTRRAVTLAAFTDPAGAFVARHQLKSNTKYSRTVHELHPSLRGFEMVIASSNNGAVENISLEIPWKDGDVIAEEFQDNTAYFARIATELLNDGTRKDQQKDEPKKQAWGLVSAKLGNSKNRTAFISTALHGDREPRADGDAVPGLVQLLENPPGPHVSSWAEARASFLAAKAKVDRLRAARQTCHEGFRDVPALRAEIAELEQVLTSDKEMLTAQEELIIGQAQELAELHRLEATRQTELEVHTAAKPGLLEQIRTSGDVMTQWRDRHDRLSAEIDHIRRSIAGLKMIFANSRTACEGLRGRYQQTQTKLSHRQEQDKEYQAQTGGSQPVDDWFDSASSSREKSSPWLDEEFNRARSKLFLHALKLHEAFIYDQRTAMRQNLLAVQDVLKSDVPAEAAAKVVRHAWEALFMVVPTITTTFASVPRLFASLKDEQLGWLFVDEAGQAAPQHALCGIARVRRAVLVGDPLQLTPVVTLPEKYQTRLLEITGTSQQWLPAHNPAQMLADRHTRYGTTIQPPGGDELWVGAPLRVHRRCDNPMFDVVNEEVYGGLMIHGEKEPHKAFPKDSPVQAPGSAWFDVQTGQWNGHASPQELTRLDELLAAMQRAGYNMDDILIVSPFRDTANGIVGVAKQYGIDTSTRSGTVHRAQGKEASIVIVVLGGKTRGARNWAVGTPNLFNVVVSRAKRRLYIIGDHRHWTELPYFKALAPRVQVHHQEQAPSDLFRPLEDGTAEHGEAPEDMALEPTNYPTPYPAQTIEYDDLAVEPLGGSIEKELWDPEREPAEGPDRHGKEWEHSDYEALITGIRYGYSDDELAIHVRRSIGGIRARAPWLLPEGTEVSSRKDALEKLREAAAEESFDWQTHVRESHIGNQKALWDPAADHALRTAWETGAPMLPALSKALEIDEESIARRLLTHGYAPNRYSVVDRLGCTPGSALDVNARLARDKAAALIWVLTVIDEHGTIQHLSLHPNQETAFDAKDSLEPGEGQRNDWEWMVAQRVVGEGSTRSSTTGQYAKATRSWDIPGTSEGKRSVP
ncbi:AAA domain-containing protein [Arthrobacter sp. efr-133-TYG-118]|uniref:DEAD/DEAH box helicase n=1 Tax=Arthrobacter sp. efr-133-TYG-118 TaxID=3040279 RepID=UPI00254D3758|nr:AAA domain-containing protein [Arthrobacter sp. efr-133-TYG-118]